MIPEPACQRHLLTLSLNLKFLSLTHLLKNDDKQLEANQLAEEEEQEMGKRDACGGESSQPRLR